MPFTNPKFGYLYGFGYLDTLFYFLLPTFILVKFDQCSIFRRMKYSAFFIGGFSLVKTIYNEEYRKKITCLLI